MFLFGTYFWSDSISPKSENEQKESQWVCKWDNRAKEGLTYHGGKLAVKTFLGVNLFQNTDSLCLSSCKLLSTARVWQLYFFMTFVEFFTRAERVRAGLVAWPVPEVPVKFLTSGIRDYPRESWKRSWGREVIPKSAVFKMADQKDPSTVVKQARWRADLALNLANLMAYDN